LHDGKAEVSEWKAQTPGFMKKASEIASRPLIWVADKMLPDNVKEKMSDLTETVVEKLQDASHWTVSPEDVLKEMGEFEWKPTSISELKTGNIHDIDSVAQSFVKSNSQMAAAEGFGTGLIGFPGLVADIPALLTLSFRLINQISLCYGYEVTDKDEKLNEKESFELSYMLRVLRVGTASTQEEKVKALIEMKDFESGYYEGIASGAVKDVTLQQVSKIAVIHLSKALLSQVVKQTVSRKAMAAIPGIGAVLSAGFNYYTIQDIGQAASMLYRERFLLDKKGRTKTINVKID
jgi:EcsC protein family